MGLEVARQGPRGDEEEGPVRQVAQDTEDGEDHEDPVGLHEQARLLQEKTEPGVGGQNLGGNEGPVGEEKGKTARVHLRNGQSKEAISRRSVERADRPNLEVSREVRGYR